MSSRFWRVSSLLLALASFPCRSQTAPSAPAAPTRAPAEVDTPNEAKERLEMAKKVNGLLGITIPWHLKARYEILAEDGKSVETGTYEEWRVNAVQYRIALHGPSASVEEYGTDHGVFRSAQQTWPGKPLSAIRGMIERPAAPPINPEKLELKNFERKFGSSNLPCTALLVQGSQIPEQDAACFCFQKTNAALVYSSNANKQFQILFQGLVMVNGHYLAKEMQLFLMGRPWLKLHIDTIEGLPTGSLSELVAPGDAALVTPRTSVPGDVTGGKLIQKVAPTYPPAAKLQGVQGTVLIHGVIGIDGHLTELQVLDGPPALRQPALDAVHDWVYSPYLMDGHPIEFETDLNVVFSLGR